MEFTIEEKIEILMRRVAKLEKQVEALENPVDLSSEQIQAMLDFDTKGLKDG